MRATRQRQPKIHLGFDPESARYHESDEYHHGGPAIFTVEDRERVFDRLLVLARQDPRLTGGAIIGSGAVEAQNRWSDIDIGFGIATGETTESVMGDWTALVEKEFGLLHHFDVHNGSSLYRVLLLTNGLELDLSLTPEDDFRARGPKFRLLFGKAKEVATTPAANVDELIGLGWHHALHARSSIERGRYWSAEYWISALRDHVLTLACLRLGEETPYARGFDKLPEAVTKPLERALVSSLEPHELRRALGVATTHLLEEIGYVNDNLAKGLVSIMDDVLPR